MPFYIRSDLLKLVIFLGDVTGHVEYRSSMTNASLIACRGWYYGKKREENKDARYCRVGGIHDGVSVVGGVVFEHGRYHTTFRIQ